MLEINNSTNLQSFGSLKLSCIHTAALLHPNEIRNFINGKPYWLQCVLIKTLAKGIENDTFKQH